MNLHQNSDNFSELVQATAASVGMPEVYVEKDYWVTKSLKNLAESAYADEVVFKGGTSLSKAYRLIDRFSEDVDLAVIKEGKSGGVIKKLIKNVETSACAGLKIIKGDARVSKSSTYRKTVYQYPREVGSESFGQASPDLLIEVNAFTHPQPVEIKELRSFVADFLIDQERGDLIQQFQLEEFQMNVLAIHRTLVEKILGLIKRSYTNDPVTELSDCIRHLYDIAQILERDEHRQFVQSDGFLSMCHDCIKDELSGFFTDSDCLNHPLDEAPLFSEFERWRPRLEVTYTGVFSQLVYDELPSMNKIEEAIAFMHSNLVDT